MKQEANRGLGDIPLRSTAALAPISRAQMDAATNLLNKALDALEVEDEARARRFVDRAVALPRDEHEGHLGRPDPEGNEFCVVEPGNNSLARG